MKRPREVIQPRWGVYALRKKAERIGDAIERALKESELPSGGSSGSASRREDLRWLRDAFRSARKPKFHDGVSWLGLVSAKFGERGVAPIRKVHNPRRLFTRWGTLAGRLYNVQSVAVEEESVIPEQLVQLPNHWMAVRKGLGFELTKGSLDLCGSQFHRTLLRLGYLRKRAFALPAKCRGVIARCGASRLEVVESLR
jgi:hypothetical protein